MVRGMFGEFQLDTGAQFCVAVEAWDRHKLITEVDDKIDVSIVMYGASKRS